jgi:hypothetical protein
MGFLTEISVGAWYTDARKFSSWFFWNEVSLNHALENGHIKIEKQIIAFHMWKWLFTIIFFVFFKEVNRDCKSKWFHALPFVRIFTVSRTQRLNNFEALTYVNNFIKLAVKRHLDTVYLEYFYVQNRFNLKINMSDKNRNDETFAISINLFSIFGACSSNLPFKLYLCQKHRFWCQELSTSLYM